MAHITNLQKYVINRAEFQVFLSNFVVENSICLSDLQKNTHEVLIIKEAYRKVHGTVLFIPVRSLSVSFFIEKELCKQLRM